MMTILSCVCKTLTLAGSRGRNIRWGAKYDSRLVTHPLEMDVSDSGRITLVLNRRRASGQRRRRQALGSARSIQPLRRTDFWLAHWHQDPNFRIARNLSAFGRQARRPDLIQTEVGFHKTLVILRGFPLGWRVTPQACHGACACRRRPKLLSGQASPPDQRVLWPPLIARAS